VKLNNLKKHLKRGRIYRREELTQWSTSVDRHLDELLQEGLLQKLSQGLYYYPKMTAFGAAPPDDDVLVSSFLKDRRFLLTSPNAYNSLGLGTTQLYNTRVVYNHKRHGELKLGNRTFDFRIKPHFPKKVTQEFLIVDMVNNLNTLAEDKSLLLNKLSVKAMSMDRKKLAYAVSEYGGVKARKLFAQYL
jgi:hypothetical protein